MLNELDHLMFAAARLDDGAELITKRLGVTPVAGGVHQGFGTQNALVGMGRRQYLEIVAPNDEGTSATPFVNRLQSLQTPKLFAYLVRTSSMSDFFDHCASADVKLLGPNAVSRMSPAGDTYEWSIAFIDEPAYLGLLPGIIDWGRTAHPSDSLSSQLTLSSFKVKARNDEALARLFGMLRIPVDVTPSKIDRMSAAFETPIGPVSFADNVTTATIP